MQLLTGSGFPQKQKLRFERFSSFQSDSPLGDLSGLGAKGNRYAVTLLAEPAQQSVAVHLGHQHGVNDQVVFFRQRP
jgi:hypothetical protein